MATRGHLRAPERPRAGTDASASPELRLNSRRPPPTHAVWRQPASGGQQTTPAAVPSRGRKWGHPRGSQMGELRLSCVSHPFGREGSGRWVDGRLSNGGSI